MEQAVLIVMGSDTDFPIMEACLKTLDTFEIPYQIRVCSAHRTPEWASRLASQAEENGYAVIIAAAGLAAHLPGVLASWTTLPVIGVPIKSGALSGQDALYAIVQMPPGVPVATVAIDGSENAAILAVQILSVSNPRLKEKLKEHKKMLAASVAAKQEKIEQQWSEHRKQNSELHGFEK